MSASRWNRCPSCGRETLREDWEVIGIDAGRFRMWYGATCMDPSEITRPSACGFTFQHTVDTPIEKEESR